MMERTSNRERETRTSRNMRRRRRRRSSRGRENRRWECFLVCPRILYVLGLVVFCAGAAMLLFSFQKPSVVQDRVTSSKLRALSPFVISIGIAMVAFGKALSLSGGGRLCGREVPSERTRRHDAVRRLRILHVPPTIPNFIFEDETLSAHFNKPPPPPYTLLPEPPPQLRTGQSSSHTSPEESASSKENHTLLQPNSLATSENENVEHSRILGEPPPPYTDTRSS